MRKKIEMLERIAVWWAKEYIMFAEGLYLIMQYSVEYINWRRDAQKAFVVEKYSAFEIMLLKQVVARGTAHRLEKIFKISLNKSDQSPRATRVFMIHFDVSWASCICLAIYVIIDRLREIE
jgi:hypothetical protein